jgi:probable phosphoglycerate mutase
MAVAVAPDQLAAGGWPLRLFLIRHGETEWSVSGQHTGRTDLAMTQRGVAQALALAPYLGATTFTAVLSSPALRARQTCQLALAGRLPEIVPELAEWDYGDFEGRRTLDIQRDRPQWSVWSDGCPNGESPGQVTARADGLLQRLAVLHGNVALFSHGQFAAALGARWIGLPICKGRHFVLSPASVSILATDLAHPDVRTIALWNLQAEHNGFA